MKQNRIKIACFMALIFLFNIIGANTQVLAKSINLEIVIPKYEDLTTLVKSEEIELKAWDITEEYNNSELDKKELVNQLKELPISQLDSKFVPHRIHPEFRGDRLVVGDLKEGVYFFNNQFVSNINVYSSQFIVTIDSNSPEKIELFDKIKIQPKEFGTIRLTKVDQDEKRLEGVGFELYQKVGEELIRVPLIGEYEYNKDGDVNKILYTDKDGQIVVNKLPYGRYVLKEVKALDGYKIKEKEKEIAIETNEEISLKIVNEKIQFGGHKFLKIANDKKQTPLKDAKFKVVVKIKDKTEPVIQNGEELYLKSDEKGEFAVDNLPYGDYELWEVKAPKGYKKLINPIDFTIDKESSSKVIIIKNELESKIPMPKTGDLMLPILMLASCTLFGTGYKLSRSENNN